MRDLRLIEMSFAYERAAGVIQSECVPEIAESPLDDVWYDLDSAADLEDEVLYLESRRLLMRHPEHANWVMICDEGDPVEEVKP